MLVQADIHISARFCSIRLKRNTTAVILALGLALLAAGCARFTYDETPTPVSDVHSADASGSWPHGVAHRPFRREPHRR